MNRIIKTLNKLQGIDIEYHRLADYMHDKKYLLDKVYFDPTGKTRFVFKNFETTERISVEFQSMRRGTEIIIIDVTKAEHECFQGVQNGIL